ncbi:glycine N-acyltransferase-like protein Keg1 [Perca flavescens]|uniref:glycine N-acyltransferase-like protein Keg1 n=1 Tax=Perca flavescens TaxID=8167 RepID=UPI00106E5A4E|nr:glycine N-acyltransferase-like protein Keg1 [Perca flavescens]
MRVDSWPTFTTAICYRQKQYFSCSSSGGIPDICTVFTKNPETQRSLLLNERVVNWRNRLVFRGRCFHCQFPFWTNPTRSSSTHTCLMEAAGGSQESLGHVRVCKRHLPNHCVSDEKGRPVSWMLSNELCELRMAYTLPEYRRAGHLLALSLALIRRMGSVGLPVYCHVNQQNQATINAVTLLGFSACPSTEKISVLLICKDRV